MIDRVLDHMPDSKEGRLVLTGVVVELVGIAASALIIPAVKFDVWVSPGGWAIFLAYLLWTVPVSAWIGIRGSGISGDGSFFIYLGSGAFIAVITGAAVLGTGIVVDIFDCGGVGDGGGDPGYDPGCVRMFPGFTSLLAFMVAVEVMFSMTFYSVVIGSATWKLRSLF